MQIILWEVKIIIIDDRVKKVGASIKWLRLKKGLSQNFVAKKLGISQSLLSNIEAGRSSVTLVNLFKLQEVLRCSMSDFFEDTSDIEPVPKENAEEQLAKVIELFKLLER